LFYDCCNVPLFLPVHAYFQNRLIFTPDYRLMSSFFSGLPGLRETWGFMHRNFSGLKNKSVPFF